MARVVLLAVAAGSGKPAWCRRLGGPVLALDDFYRDHDDRDDPPMPHRFGIVDWDDPGSWDAVAALSAIEALCHTGIADIPVYDIPTSRRSGTARLDLAGAGLFVAEGIFAAELVHVVRERGVLADALCLQLHPAVTFARRLLRDLSESRKPPITLLRRGFGLALGEARLIRHWIESGCRPVSIARAEQALRSLGA